MPGHYLVALVLFLLGLSLFGCGANVCWLRWRRGGRKKTVKELQDEDRAARRETPEKTDPR